MSEDSPPGKPTTADLSAFENAVLPSDPVILRTLLAHAQLLGDWRAVFKENRKGHLTSFARGEINAGKVMGASEYCFLVSPMIANKILEGVEFTHASASASQFSKGPHDEIDCFLNGHKDVLYITRDKSVVAVMLKASTADKYLNQKEQKIKAAQDSRTLAKEFGEWAMDRGRKIYLKVSPDGTFEMDIE